MHVGDGVTKWLVCWTPDRVVWVQVLAGVMTHCVVFFGKDPLLSQCLSDSTLVPAHYQGNLAKMLGGLLGSTILSLVPEQQLVMEPRGLHAMDCIPSRESTTFLVPSCYGNRS